MILKTRNFDLIRDREFTYLTAAADAAATSLTVKSTDLAAAGTSSNTWADNDYMIVGEIGSENAEIMQMAAAVTSATSLTIDREGSAGGLRYAHAVGEPVYKILFNQAEFSRATTATGTKTVLSTTAIQPDGLFTSYQDATNITGYGFVRFKNSTASTYSSYSSAINYTGYGKLSVGRMLKAVRRLLGEENVKFLDDDEIIEEINAKQRDVAQERLWSFYETFRSASRVKDQRRYAIDDDVVVGKAHTVTVDSEPMAIVPWSRMVMFNWDMNREGEPTHCAIFNNALNFYPLPDAAASTDTLDGAITASATEILLDDTDGFRAPGRALIGSEVISYEGLTSTTALNGALTAAATTVTVDSTTGFPSAGTITINSEDITYTGTTSTTFTGCTRAANSTTAAAHSDNDSVTASTLVGCRRGLEGTTAATALDGATITERDIIYSAHEEPTELADIGDETKIPDPQVLIYGTAMELALSKLSDQVLHDRLRDKYERSLERLRDKFGKKATASFPTIRDKDDYVRDWGVDPNLYPEDFSGHG